MERAEKRPWGLVTPMPGSAWASPQTNRLGVEWTGLCLGLGFVLSFGYWCTDFLVVQRAMAADSMESARRTPLIAAFPKMLFPALVILPGLVAMAVPATLATHAADARLGVKHAAGTRNHSL